MTRIRTDTAAVVALGARIAGMAGDVAGATAAAADPGAVCEPPATAEALTSFAEAYGRSARRLHDDVVALGRLTQVTGTQYAAVEAAALRLLLARSAPLTTRGPGG